jgi:uncharacterized protein YbjT (DUF2867 family)
MADGAGPVLVIGATGQQGGAVARELLARGRAVHALVRDLATPAAQSLRSAGAALVLGDLDDPASLRNAMNGVHGVFLVLNMMTGPYVTLDGVAAEERRGTMVAEIANKIGVGHLVYSSIYGADLHTGIVHVESKGRIEEHIRALDLPATVLRPASFMENFGTFSRPQVVDGELVVSLALRPETPLAMTATRDIGAFAAIAFDRPARFIGRHIRIVGDDLTGPAIAATLGTACGLPARFQQVPIERLRAFDAHVAQMFEWFDERDADKPDYAALHADHPGLMTLATWARETGWKPA